MEPSATTFEHHAPPPYRPLSGGAITALVLALLLAPIAIFGPWWLEFLPLVVAALAWPAIADGRRRGGGVAISAAVVAVLVGVTAVAFVGGSRRAMEEKFDSLLVALSADDRPALSTWVLQGEDAPAAVARWRDRFVAVERLTGPYGRRVDVAWGLWGPFVGLSTPPAGELVEVGGAPDEARPGPGTLWFGASFAREHVVVALVVGGVDGQLDLERVVAEAQASGKLAVLREVRFFRVQGGREP